MCLCFTGLAVSSVLKEVTYHRPVDKICSSDNTSELFLEVNIYNISKSTDYTDVPHVYTQNLWAYVHTVLQTRPYSLACQPSQVHRMLSFPHAI